VAATRLPAKRRERMMATMIVALVYCSKMFVSLRLIDVVLLEEVLSIAGGSCRIAVAKLDQPRR